MNRPYVKPAMLECRRHPELGLWCREDGKVLVPAGSRGRKEHWTFGYKEPRGYMRVVYRGKPYLVHKLIAESFLKNEFNLPTIDHKNRVRDDNRLENIRFASYKTQADNQKRVDDSIAKYGVRCCDNVLEYMMARYAADPERERARKREQYAADPEHKLAMNRAYRTKQKALGRRYRRCPDGSRQWLTDEEYDARFGQSRLF